MDIFTEHGIKISVIKNEESDNRLLVFDRPVKLIELTKTEATKLGSLMIRDKQVGITTEVRKLIHNGFFKKPKSFKDIKNELLQNNISVKISSLNIVLSKLVERNELLRDGRPRSYIYFEKND
jgi:uncharacterized protein (UPF0128 family)